MPITIPARVTWTSPPRSRLSFEMPESKIFARPRWPTFSFLEGVVEEAEGPVLPVDCVALARRHDGPRASPGEAGTGSRAARGSLDRANMAIPASWKETAHIASRAADAGRAAKWSRSFTPTRRT